MLVGLCSCQFKKEMNEPTTVAGTTGAEFYTEEITDEITSEAPSETVTQPVQTTVAPTTAPQTQPQQEPATQAPEVTGTKTITDGNKTIIYPLALESSQKTYPVISWANGTGADVSLYTNLLTLLAEGGYIVVADKDPMTADGTSQIDSINYIINKNSDSSSIFYNKVDTYAIGVCGHSQGGRSCINAAQKDSRIRCIVSIAGSSYTDEVKGLTTPCLFLTGTSDMVVVSSQWCKPAYNEAIGRAAYASLKGGVHTTCTNLGSPQKISGYTLDWFDAYLKNDDNAKQVFYNGGKLATDSAWQDFQNKN